MLFRSDYGQRHRVELECAAKIIAPLGIRHETADLRSISNLLGGSSQTDDSVEVPLGHYEAENMKQTVVPNRNMILLSLAAAWAIGEKADSVAYAAHAGDHAIYPDCRSEFAEALGGAIALADWHEVKLLRPFRPEEHTSELPSRTNPVCPLPLVPNTAFKTTQRNPRPH